MKPRVRLAAALAALVLLYLGRATHPAAVRHLEDGRQLSRTLDERMALVHSIRDAKRDVAAAVIAGRLTLFEAAAEFQALDERNPDFHWRTFRALPGDSDGERFCWMVMRHVENLLQHRPPTEAEAVLAGLQEELQAHLREHGTVTLPQL